MYKNLPISTKFTTFADEITTYISYLIYTTMAKYICDVCGYEYDPDVEGKAFNELPEDWVCPVCGVGKDQFSEA